MIRIAIVEDHLMFRQALKSSLNLIEEFEVVEEASCGAEYEMLFDPEKIDITLLDIRLAGQHGPQTCINLKKKYPDTRIIIMSTYDDNDIILRMIQNGASAFVPKTKTLSDFECAIRMVHKNGFYFDMDLGDMLIKNYHTAQQQKLIGGVYQIEFTDIEMQIAIMGCQGLTNKEMAEKLNIKERTVENHKTNLFVKVNTHYFGGVMIYMFKHNLLFPHQF